MSISRTNCHGGRGAACSGLWNFSSRLHEFVGDTGEEGAEILIFILFFFLHLTFHNLIKL